MNALLHDIAAGTGFLAALAMVLYIVVAVPA
jgi:hypothetical protein